MDLLEQMEGTLLTNIYYIRFWYLLYFPPVRARARPTYIALAPFLDLRPRCRSSRCLPSSTTLPPLDLTSMLCLWRARLDSFSTCSKLQPLCGRFLFLFLTEHRLYYDSFSASSCLVHHGVLSERYLQLQLQLHVGALGVSLVHSVLSHTYISGP